MKPKIQTVVMVIISLVIVFYSCSAFGTGTWNWYKHGNTVYDVTAQGEYIWCATRSGIVKWNRLDGTYEQINPFHNNNFFRSIAVDDNGVVWLTSNSSNIIRFHGSTAETFTDVDGISLTNVTAITFDQNGMVWCSGWGIACFDGVKWSKYNKVQTPETHCFASAADSNGVVWFASLGAYSFDGTEWKKYTSENGLTDLLVKAIAVDKNGVVWFGAHDGAYRYDGTVWTEYTTEDGPVNNTID